MVACVTMPRSTLPPRLRRRRRCPRRLAVDKGYSDPRPWRWLSRRRVERVIPTRKHQLRAADFDKAVYRKRNVIERAIGSYKGVSPAPESLREAPRQLARLLDHRRRIPLDLTSETYCSKELRSRWASSCTSFGT